MKEASHTLSKKRLFKIELVKKKFFVFVSFTPYTFTLHK